MAGGFDPDAFLAETAPADKAGGNFDPDAFLKQTETVASDATGSTEPTLSGSGTRLYHAMRHLSGGLTDPIYAAEQAALDTAYDKTGQTHFVDAYHRNLAANDKLLDASDKAHPLERWEGNALGFAGNLAALGIGDALSSGASAVAPTLAQLSRAGMKVGGALGLAGGFGNNRSESLGGTLLNMGMGGLFGAATGAAAPYVADVIGGGAKYLGGKAEDLAGWLKVHSIHPTPTVGEKMAELPGGEIGVGKQLLEQGLGGLTKKSTAAQIDEATNAAGKGITEIAKAHDAAGGPPVSLNSALAAGWKAAGDLKAEPVTEAAGERLWNMLDKYETKYVNKPVSAAEALALKRAVAKAAYGAGQQFERSGDTISGDFGAGLSKFERAIDDTLDKHLGPEFERANLVYRQLRGASQAADRTAARGQTNHILGLTPAVVGGGALAGHGAPEAAGAAIATALAGKYGSQVGSRLLYSPVAGSLNLLGRGLQSLPGALSSSAASEGAAPLGGTLADLFATNPTFAQGRK